VSEDWLGEEEFVMYLGDNILKEGVGGLVRTYLEERPNALILLTRVKEPERFGVAELRDGRVVRLVEKPKVPPSDLALVGVYVFDRHIFQAARAIRPSWRGELEITDAIQKLIDDGYEVRPKLVKGWWKDTGRLEDLLEANRLLLEEIEPENRGEVVDSELLGRVVLQDGARVVRSTIRGPAIVGEGTLVQDSYIGPFTSIYYGCEIVESEIEHSIVLENSRIRGIRRIEDSLIGKEVEVSPSDEKPRAFRLMLGDHSRVKVV
jgi:glucose-1-phosphate thymidylyltransferase